MDAKKTLTKIGFFTGYGDNSYEKCFPLDEGFDISIRVHVDCNRIYYRVAIVDNDLFDCDLSQIVIAEGYSYAKTDEALEDLFVNSVPNQAKTMLETLTLAFDKIGAYFRKNAESREKEKIVK